MNAKKFDNLNSTNETVEAAFVEEALMKDGEDIYIDERAISERADKGLPVWR